MKAKSLAWGLGISLFTLTASLLALSQAQAAPLLQAGCAEQIANGGFENGTNSTPWVEGSPYELMYDPPPPPVTPHGGSWIAWLGGVSDLNETLSQTVSIPNNAVTATLSYWWYMATDEIVHPADYLYLQIRDENGALLETLETLSDGSTEDQWLQSTFNVITYTGQTIQVYFNSVIDPSPNVTSFYLDDVSLQACISTQPLRPKPLYLHNLAASVTIVDGTNTTEILDRQQVWGGEATVTFDNSPLYRSYLYPGLAEALALEGTITIPLYFDADTNQDSNVTVRVADLAPNGSTTIIGSDTVLVPEDVNGWYTFTIVGVDYVVDQGHALRADMWTASPAQDVTLRYDSAIRNSRVELPARNYVNVNWARNYDDAYPTGAEKSSFVADVPVYIRARVSDPFGSYDVTTATVAISSTAYSMSEVYDSGIAYKIYETVYTPTITGTHPYTVTVSEGSEGVVTDTETGQFYVSSYGVSIYPDATRTTDPDTSVDYPLTLENLGAVSDTFNVTVSASTQSWATELYVGATLVASDTDGDGTWDSVNPAYDSDGDGNPDFTLDASGTQGLILRKIVPPSAGEVVDTTRLVATSSGDPLASDVAILTTSTMVAVEYKQLHLLESGANDTMSTQPGSSNSTLAISEGSFNLWTQSPPFASDFDLRQGALTVSFYVSNFSPANPWWRRPLARVTVYSGTTSLGYDQQRIDSVGWYAFTIANPDTTIPAGGALSVRVDNWLSAPPGSSFAMRYGGLGTYDAQLDVPTKTYVEVEQVETKSACHPEGTLAFSQGQAMTITARVSDPFGSQDVTATIVTVTDPGGTAVVPGAAMTPAVTTTGAITYEHVYIIPTTATLGFYSVVVTATESNGVYDDGDAVFTVQNPAILTASLSAAPTTVNTGQTITVTMAVTNAGQATANSAAPSALTGSGTGSATLASGPTPASDDVPGGGTATFTWVYTATGAGTLDWTGSITGTDANSCALVSSPVITSNEVLVQAPAALSSALRAMPTQVSTGQTVTVTMTVTNTGGVTATGVTPSALTLGGTGSATLSSGPTPASTDIPGGGTATFTWVYTATSVGTVNWTGNAAGTDAVFGTPVSSIATTSNDVVVLIPAALSSTLHAAPTVVPLGGPVTVTMAVTNTGQVTATSVSPSALTLGGTGSATLSSGPTPASTDIPGGGTATFTWVYTATAAGTVNWTGNAAGTDAVFGTPVSSTVTTSNDVVVLVPAALSSTLHAAPTVIQLSDPITVTMAVTNTGGVTATGVTPSALTLGGTGSAALVSGPTPASTDIPSGGTVTFTWIYTATGYGTVNWTGNVTGTDAIFGTPVSSTVTTSNDVVVLVPAALSSTLHAAPTVVSSGGLLTVTMAVTNTGGVTATSVSPSALTLGGTGSAALVSGPTPASDDVPGGGTVAFTWVYTATGYGTVNWTGNVTGTDAVFGTPVSSTVTTSNDVVVLVPAALSSTLHAAPTVVQLSDFITVTMAVTNTGQVTATGVTPSALTLGGAGSAALVSGPVPASTDIPGGGTATFTWVYTATDYGAVNWTGNAAGTDDLSGTPVSSTASTSNNVYVIPDLRLEVGTVSVGDDWVTVNLANTYSDMVVVCSLQNDENNAPVVTRIQNAEGGSFQVKLQAAGTGAVPLRPIHYMVMETGAYTLPNGALIEAQKYTSTVTSGRGNWPPPEFQTYLRNYSNPVVVMAQVMSYNDTDWSTFHEQGVNRQDAPTNSTLGTSKLVSKDTDTTRNPEVIGFIVIEQSYGEIFGVAYEAWLGNDSVAGMDNSPPYNYTFQRVFTDTPSVALVAQAGEDGGDGGWAVLYGNDPLATDTISLAIDEDNINGNRSHTTEQVAYLVFEKPFAIGGTPLLDVSKEAHPQGVRPGDALCYAVDYVNNSLVPATSVVITDQLPADTIFGDASPGCVHDGSPTDGSVTCTVGTLEPDGSGTVAITVTVVSTLTENTVLTNTATIGSAEGASDTASITTSVTAFSLLKLEAFTTTVASDWITVTLGNTYYDMVVVCTPNYDSSSNPMVTRVRNASGSSFEVRLQNPGDGDPVVTSTVHCLVMEAGAFELADGRKIEAQKYASSRTDENNSWVGEQQSYLQNYVNPVVLGQVMSADDSGWSVFWDRGSSRTDPPSASNLWTGKHVGEDTDTTRTTETVGFIVIEEGSGHIGSVAYEARLGGDSVRGVDNSPPYSYTFVSSFDSPPQVAMVSQAGMDGSDGGWAILYGDSPLTLSQIGLAIDEDQIGGSERNHTTEQVAYLVFEEPVVITPTHELYISKADSPDPVAPSGNLVYTLLYTNTSALTTTNVVITETYDGNVNFVSANPPPDVSNNVWNIGALGPGVSGAIVITVTVDSGLSGETILTNIATIDSDQTTPFADIELTTVEYLVYQIEAHVGNMAIIARVRLGPDGPVILSWEILP